MYFIIAGKEEGFDYSNAKVLGVDSEFGAEAVVNSLRAEGYKIFIITEKIRRIDDFASA